MMSSRNNGVSTFALSRKAMNPAFQRQLGCFVCRISAKDGRASSDSEGLLGQVGKDVQPVQRVLDVVVLEAGGMQLALEVS